MFWNTKKTRAKQRKTIAYLIENSQNIKKINKKEQNYRYDFKSKNIKYCIQKQLFGNIAQKKHEILKKQKEICEIKLKSLKSTKND